MVLAHRTPRVAIIVTIDGTPWGGGYVLLKIYWRGCAPQVFATLPLAMETEGQNHTFGYGKWVKIKPLTTGNVTKLTTCEAILHEIGQIWPKSCHLIWKKWWNLAKICWKSTLGYWASAKNRPLATDLGSKGDPCGRHTPSEAHITNTPAPPTHAHTRDSVLKMKAFFSRGDGLSWPQSDAVWQQY